MSKAFSGWASRSRAALRSASAGPFDADDLLGPRAPAEFRPEAIGYLTTPVDVAGWTRVVQERFVFMRRLDDFELHVARCSRGDEREVRAAIAEFSAWGAGISWR